MKKTMRLFKIIFLLTVTIFFLHAMIQATPDIIGISNLTGGEQKAGTFEINGIVLNNGLVSKVAVKVGNNAPWESAEGIEHWRYQLNSRQIVIGYENKYDSGLGKFVKTFKRGPFYGSLNITVGAFNVKGDILAEKTVSINIVPEKPYSNIISGEYGESLNVVLKAVPDVNIYYTTNGKDPCTFGYYYSGAINVYQDTVIKAVARSQYGTGYSEVLNLDIKINANTQPTYKIEYYADDALTRPLPEPPYLKAGTYYLKIITNKKYSSGPYLTIDAPGSINDVNQANLTSINDYVYRYMRIVTNDAAATGGVQEVIKFNGIDNHGNSVQNVTPVNFDIKAAYPDTQPPAQGRIALTGGAMYTNDPTPLLAINSTGAYLMRIALSESGLATATWVSYAVQYDEFDISNGGKGNKTIWIEFKDRAGNIQTQHASTSVDYDNTTLSFDIEYYTDSTLSRTLGENPYLKAGTYFLKITANQDLNYNPTVQINAEGANNDIPSGLTTKINSKNFFYTRTIVTDGAALGLSKEQITVQGIAPSNVATKAAYTDTQPPGIPVVSGAAVTESLKPTWSWNYVTGAEKYRYSFSDGSNWIETTATSFTPENDLVVATHTLYVQAGDSTGNWSENGSFSTTIINVPHINVKQGETGIPNGTGNFDFGSISAGSTSSVGFTIENTGTGNLSLTGSPKVQVSGMDASQFSVTAQPSSPVSPNGDTTFTVRFSPTSSGSKTATISIASSDSDKNPYEFTITGTGDIKPILFDTWTQGIIANGGVMMYSFNAVIGKSYVISWDDSFQGSGVYTCNVKISGYQQDLLTSYFTNVDSGYTSPRTITALDNTVYIKVTGYNSYSGGSYALKVSLSKPAINIKQGTTNIQNGNGAYNYGDVSYGLTSDTVFTIENTGNSSLNLTGTPKVQISGTDASHFSVSAQPSSLITSGGSATYTIRFAPTSSGTKTATVSIANDDIDKNPYEYTITGTGTAPDTLTLDTWTQGNLAATSAKMYCFNAIAGHSYSISWDDSSQGSGVYICDIKVSGFRQDLTTSFFTDIDSGYIYPRTITALDNIVYVKVTGYNSNSSGSYALKVSLSKPAINIKQGTTNIQNGNGVYNYGDVSYGLTSDTVFTIENTGNSSLNLTGTPKVQISGTDASQFSVSAQPSSPISSGGSATYTIRFAPTISGTKTATVSIANDDIDKNPYEFTITGTGISPDTLTLDTWTQGNLAATSAKMYCFNAIAGHSYFISWDDSNQGSGTYSGNIDVTAYRQDLLASYFYRVNSGYSTPQVITAMDNVVFIRVDGAIPGNYSLKVSEAYPIVNVKQGTTDIPNGTGNYDYGNVSIFGLSTIYFTIENKGTRPLNLVGNPRVQISGMDASQFIVSTQPYSSVVGPNSYTTFAINFIPTKSGTKTATVSIQNDDTNKNPYEFTITGTGVAEDLPFDSWTQGNLTNLAVKTYSFNATIGKSYTISWDDSHQGTGVYTGYIAVSAYHKDLSTSYFANTSLGYSSPREITAVDDLVYIKVTSFSSGSFALKVTELQPIINVKQGTTDIIKGTGSFDFGNTAIGASGSSNFMIQNKGTRNLNLISDLFYVQISGTDASQFRIVSQPVSPVVPGGNTPFIVEFTPTSPGLKTAKITIKSNDTNNSPYEYTVTGTGTGTVEALNLDTWTPGNIADGEYMIYSFNATIGKLYSVSWNDKKQGTGAYTCDIKISVYRNDLIATYFTNNDSGYNIPQYITVQDNLVFIKVSGFSSSESGSYALKVSEYIPRPVIDIKQGSNTIPKGMGSYNYGYISIGSNCSTTFTLYNTGDASLNLTGSPKVELNGVDASQFSVTAQPLSLISPNTNIAFTICFSPASYGIKTATVSIANDDPNGNPYEFTISGTGVETLNLDSWTQGNLTSSGEVKIYALNVTSGKTYAINWDDNIEGSGVYTCDIKVSGYWQNSSSIYFTDVDSGYIIPRIITAMEGVIYLKVAGNNPDSTGSYALKVSEIIPEPAINVKQGTTNIPSGTGIYNYGNVSVYSTGSFTFTIENPGTGALNLTGSPKVQLSGADASQFSVTAQPSSSVAVYANTTFAIRFAPISPGLKTATVSIANNDTDKNPYQFTITGTGVIEELIPGSWTEGNLTTSGEVKMYSVNTTVGKTYAIKWADTYQGSSVYSCDIKVSGYRQDLTTAYFSNVDSGYVSPQIITAQNNVIYIKVNGYNASSTGSYALKVYELISGPGISVRQGTTDIPDGTGSCNYGSISTGSTHNITFTIENPGTSSLNLTGAPKVQINGPDAAEFRVVSDLVASVSSNGNTTFKISFTPSGSGLKTATVSIANDNADKNPYDFTITGTGVPTESLTLGTWTPGSITTQNDEKLYSFNATIGRTYAINWDDNNQGSGVYTGYLQVASYRQDLTSSYFNYTFSGYTTPRIFTAWDNIVYIKVLCWTAGNFAIRVSEIVPEPPVINVKQGTTTIPNGSGNYDFGSVSTASTRCSYFTIENTGTSNLNLTGSSRIQLSGANATEFSVMVFPASPVVPYGSASFKIGFTPAGIGVKTATVSIVSNDADQSPYQFTITGTGISMEVLPSDVWTQGSFSTPSDTKMYSFNAIIGKTYVISWDEYQGSGVYNGGIHTSAYRQDLTTSYFTNIDSGYANPRVITAQDNIVYIKAFCNNGTGTYALKVSETLPTLPSINIKQGTTNIPIGTGSYNYGDVSTGSTSSIYFTIVNSGATNLNLTGNPRVQLSGVNASEFSVTSQPASPVIPNGSATFKIGFTPVSIGSKTATVSITTDDSTKNTYTFTIIGAGIPVGALPLNLWSQGELTNGGDIRMFAFNATVGNTYAISWDDSYQSPGTYTCNIKTTAYHQDLVTAYFSNIDSGYTSPRIIIAQDNIVYLKVAGYDSSSTGNFALNVSEIIPESSVINIKQGTTNISNGTGSFNYGDVSLKSSCSISFTIENRGSSNLNLTGSPKIQLSGANASEFSVTGLPSSTIMPYGYSAFTICFTPVSTGTKTATVSVFSDDSDKSPYEFTITGTASAMEVLAPDTWTQGDLHISGYTKLYSFNATIGKRYSIMWDDWYEGSGTYSADLIVSCYRQNLTTNYFYAIDSGYVNPQFITAQDNVVYITVSGRMYHATGGFALKISEITPEPIINVKQENTNIPNGTGSYNFGNVVAGLNRSASFTIQNTGSGDLNLSGSPQVQLSGADASHFGVSIQPSSPVASYGSTFLMIYFAPKSSGVKTVTVSIPNNDTDQNPYQFTITGTGTPPETLPLDTWTQGNLVANNETKVYCANVTIGKTYAIYWDDSYNGSGAYTCDIKVSGYRQDLITKHFFSVNSAYTAPQIITAQDNEIYFKVENYVYNSTGSYALKVTEVIPEPTINVRQGTTNIPNGTGSYDFGNVSWGETRSIDFVIENLGTSNLNLTGNPKVQISGANASLFSVANQPSSPIPVYSVRTVYINFAPDSIGIKTATVSIASDDADKSPYVFTITGTGVNPEALTLDTWTQGTLTVNKVKMYSFNAVNGKTYTVNWDDSYQGTGTRTGDISVTGYRSNMTTTYFDSINSGFTMPKIITAQDNIVYLKVYAWSTGSYALKVTEIIPEPIINVKQGINNIPNGTGSYDFGNVSFSASRNVNFTLENLGTGNLNLTGNPKVLISGADASQFSVSPPFSPVVPFGSVSLYINFAPTSFGLKTATISIASDDTDKNPYQFTITGTGEAPEMLTLDTWTQGSLTVSNNIKMYSFSAVIGKTYAINWDNGYQGSGSYTSQMSVMGYRQDLTTIYFYNTTAGYTQPQLITAQDNMVYLKVWASSNGNYALKVSEIITEPNINVKQGTTNIQSGTGSYDFGNVSFRESRSINFTLENPGTANLNLTGSPKVQINGADASQFSVYSQPSSPVGPFGSTTFYIDFTPTSFGLKTATVNIANNDTDKNPYMFTITGTETEPEVLTPDTWTQGTVTGGKTYSFNTVIGKTYAVNWDDKYQGTGTYTGDICVTAYRQDLTTTYFSSITSGYTTPQLITAQDNMVYFKVYAYSSGSYALKAVEIITEPNLNIKQDTVNIPNGTGSYDFGHISFGTTRSFAFSIENSGTGNLNLTGSPKVQLNGADASQFIVTTQPSSPIPPSGYGIFYIKFAPTSAGLKTATVSLINDDADKNPYQFTITGTGDAPEVLTLDTWTPRAITLSGEEKMYSFNGISGQNYVISWDDRYQGSSAYTCDIKVSGYRQDLTTAYFFDVDSGYTSPWNITAMDNVVYIKVASYTSSSTGSYALKVSIADAAINVKQGTTDIPNGAGTYDFGNVSSGSTGNTVFTIQNTGNAILNLTGSPKVLLSGTDASQFSVTSQPSSSVTVNGSTTFKIGFIPTSSGVKTATVSIINNDTDRTPYQFTITGTGTQMEVLTLDTWTSGSLTTGGDIKMYSFNATIGNSYSISWDDSYQGSGTYTGDISVTGYRQNLTTAYFSGINSGYTAPRIIVAQDNVVYIKVAGYTSSSTGSFSLKVCEIIPEVIINVKQGTNNILSGVSTYDYGNVSTGSVKNIIYTIENQGTGNLNLTGNPKVQLSGTDASQFNVKVQPASPVAPYSHTAFTMSFNPSSSGLKTATVSMANDDSDKNPYEFTITGTGIAMDGIPFATWIQGSLATGTEVKTYSFNATIGKTYSISWDDSYQGSSIYTCDVKASGYRQDLSTTYFSNIDSAYTIPQSITAQDNIVYIKVTGYSASSTGSFALKVTEVP